MSMGSFYFWIIAAPVVLVAGSVLLASVFRRRRDELLATTGRGAIGRVLAVGSDGDGLGSTSYWVRVEYSYDGELVNALVRTSQREQQRYQVGKRVGLTYAPSRPGVVRLDPPEWPLPRASGPGRTTDR
jgi:hypothetical protein